MKTRIMDTEDECSRFCTVVRGSIPKEYLRSISKFYPNQRKSQYSNEGRVYIDVDFLSPRQASDRDARNTAGHKANGSEICRESNCNRSLK